MTAVTPKVGMGAFSGVRETDIPARILAAIGSASPA